ncbi:hypothetical protein RB595_008547 [Gaeumannomyces hyphopodioides]
MAEAVIAAFLETAPVVLGGLLTIYNYYKDLESVPDEVMELRGDVEAASFIIERIRHSLEARRPGSQLGDGAVAANVESALRCLRTVADFADDHQERMARLKGGLLRGIPYTWEKEDILKHRTALKGRIEYLKMMQDELVNGSSDDIEEPPQLQLGPRALRSPLASPQARQQQALPRSELSRWWNREHSRSLVEAAAAGDLRAMASHMDAGADVNYQSRGGGDEHAPKLGGMTPLRAAAAGGRADAVRLLLDRDATDPNLRAETAGRDTALHSAARNGHADVVRLLCGFRRGRSVDLDAQDAHGRTPLLVCTDEAAMVTLLRAGADPTHRGGGSSSSSSEAISTTTTTTNNNGNTLLHNAASYGFADAARELVANRDVDVDALNGAGETPLDRARLALASGLFDAAPFEDVIGVLLRAGAADPMAACRPPGLPAPSGRPARSDTAGMIWHGEVMPPLSLSWPELERGTAWNVLMNLTCLGDKGYRSDGQRSSMRAPMIALAKRLAWARR